MESDRRRVWKATDVQPVRYNRLSERQTHLLNNGRAPELAELRRYEGELSTCVDCGDQFIPHDGRQQRCVPRCNGKGTHRLKKCCECGRWLVALNWRIKKCGYCRGIVGEPWHDIPTTKQYREIHAELASLVARGSWDEYVHHHSGQSAVDPNQVFRCWAAHESCKTLAEYQRRWNLFIRRRQKEWERHIKDAEPVRGIHVINGDLTAFLHFDLKVTDALISSVDGA